MTTSTPVPPVTTAIVLVAGIGSRLRPHTETTPKCLLTVGDGPLLFRFLRQLQASGIKTVYLITGHRSETIEESVVGLAGVPELILVHNPDYSTFGSALSLQVGFRALLAAGEFGDTSSVLVADGDLLIESSNVLKEVTETNAPDVFVVEYKEDIADTNLHRLHRNLAGYVDAIGDDFAPEMSQGQLIGISRFSGRSIRYFLAELEGLSREELEGAYYESIFGRSEERLRAFQVIEVPSGSFIEVDTAKDLDAARAMAELWS